MTTTCFRNLLTAVVCLFAGVSAQAQFTGTYEDYVAEGWDAKNVEFTLSEVAKALDVESEALVTALNSWTSDGSSDADMFFLKVGEELSNNYTQGSKGGFWVNVEGAPQAWSDDNSALRWYNTIAWDSEANKFTVSIGQFPGQCSLTDVFTPQFVLKYGEKQATFDITIKFVERPVYDIPEPATLVWKDLNVVSEITVDVQQKQRTGYDADNVEVDLKEAIAKLGITDLTLIQNELKKLLYITEYYIGEDVALGGMKGDTLTNEPSANGIGFWIRAYDDATEPNIECGRASYGNSQFYMEAFAFDAEKGVLSCNMGQMPNSLKGDTQYFTYIYLIFGDKAICIRYNLNVEKVELNTLDSYEQAGEQTVELTMEPMTSYTTKNFSVNIDSIAAALGCEVSEIEFCALANEVEFANSNADNGGFWFNMDGLVIGWGESAMVYVMPVVAGNFSKLGIGQYPGHLNEGDEISVSVYFVGNGKYFKLNVKLKIETSEVFEGDFVSVGQRSIEVQQQPVSYEWTPGIAIPAEWVEEQIGTSDWVVYGLAALNDDGTEKAGNERYTKNYTCTPYPGFWLNGEGRNNGWNSNARIGITAAAPDLPDGGFSLMQYEGGVCNIGDVFKTQLFLVNEANGKMVTFNFTYSIVESVQEIEVVGTETLTIPVNPMTVEEGKGITLDLATAATALGTTVDELSKGEYLRGMTEEGNYGNAFNLFDGLMFSATGYNVIDEGSMYFEVELNEDGTTATLTLYSNEAVAEDYTVSGQFCLQVDNKRYVYDVKFVSEDIFSGIGDIRGKQTVSNAVYDLSGRRIINAQMKKGLYIQNGRKFLVK